VNINFISNFKQDVVWFNQSISHNVVCPSYDNVGLPVR